MVDAKVSKRVSKGFKKGFKSPLPLPPLTAVQSEILYLISKEFLTSKQVACRRKTSVQAVNKVVRKLKKLGLLGVAKIGVSKNRCTLKPFEKIRLHGEELNVRILYKDERYLRVVGRTVSLDGNTVRCFKNSLEIYSGQSFFGSDPRSALSRSMSYWPRFFSRLEHEFNIIVFKPRSQNIKFVKAHFAEVGNAFARDCEVRGDKIVVRSTDDGKLWFLIDNSFNLHEAETVHPESSFDDMDGVIQPFFNDLRDNRPPTLSEIMVLLDKLAVQNLETASGLGVVVRLLTPKSDVSESSSLPDPDYFG